MIADREHGDDVDAEAEQAVGDEPGVGIGRATGGELVPVLMMAASIM
jgi:hypothetical protein